MIVGSDGIRNTRANLYFSGQVRVRLDVRRAQQQPAAAAGEEAFQRRLGVRAAHGPRAQLLVALGVEQVLVERGWSRRISRCSAVGLNLLPHAVRELAQLGLEEPLARKGVLTQELCFYTSLGQKIYGEARGRVAGYQWPQISIHRADLHAVLVGAVRERLGADAIALGQKCVGMEQDAGGAVVHLTDAGGKPLSPVRRQGRDRLRWHPFGCPCSDASRRGRPALRRNHAVSRRDAMEAVSGRRHYGLSGPEKSGKLIIYPIRNEVDAEGRQLINWVIEVVRPADQLLRDWNRKSQVAEFIDNFEHCAFDWLDIPAVLRANDAVYEYPMVDQDPLPFWTRGNITLLGDAAHPMMPRGSNGAAQAIIDATTLAKLLAAGRDSVAAKEYEALRLKATSDVVLANRGMAPDGIIGVVEDRAGGKRFNSIDDVISPEQLKGWQDRYRAIAGFAVQNMKSDRASA